MKNLIRKLLALSAFAAAALMFAQPANALIRVGHTEAWDHCMDAEGGKIAAGTRIVYWWCHNQPHQRIWIQFDESSGTPDGFKLGMLRFDRNNDFCIDADMIVKPMGQCRPIVTRNVGGNRYVLGMTQEICYYTVWSARFRGQQIPAGACDKQGAMKGLPSQAVSTWFVEQ